jgi:hypothetical protein
VDKARTATLGILFGLGLVAGCAVGTSFETRLVSGPAELCSGQLGIVVADNGAYGTSHRAGYSGVSELRHGDSNRNVFVPAYAGLNFEHIFAGDASCYGWDKFEPRKAPMDLFVTGDRRVELRQERTTNWPLQTTIEYELSNDGAVDFVVRCTPRADRWGKHGYIGLFFASYIHAPEDLGINFLGRGRSETDARPRWIHHVPPRHGEQACHRPAGSDWDPTFDEGFPITLASAASDYEYAYPFFYGVTHGKLLLFMFRRSNDRGELRIAQSPSGGGRGNPAWDFVWFQRDYAVDEEFRFAGRLVCKDFAGRKDVIRTYERWSGQTVQRTP